MKFPVCILANDLELPENVGSLFRIADALGVEKLFLTGRSPVPPNRKLRKTSRATERAVAYEHRAEALPLVLQLKAEGYAIVSLEITPESRDLRSFDGRAFDKFVLIVGAENHGVAREILAASDHTLHIPMFGQNTSMNLANACAIAVFELTRRFMPAP